MKPTRTVLLLLTLLTTLVTAAPVRGAEQTSTWLTWGNSGNYIKATQNVKIVTKAPQHFWALQWQWSENPALGGYLGVQTDGILFDGQVTEMAIFSVWGATGSRAATGSRCDAYNPAGENGAGLSCRRALPVAEGHTYQLQVTRTSTRNNMSTYSASVRDLTARKSYPLGTLTSPGRMSIRETNNFIEDFSSGNSACASTAPAAALFGLPRATQEKPRRSVRMAYKGASLGGCARAAAIETVKRGSITDVLLSK